MKVQIWSDIVCPFCYIGKRKFEKALAAFKHQGKLTIEWKSFQLDSKLISKPGKNLNEYLAESKGWSLEHACEMNDYVTAMAEQVGLEYHLDKAIVANSLNAHRLMHLAKLNGNQNAVAELLFKSYFTDGENIDSHVTLERIGAEAGIDEKKIQNMLNSDEFTQEVKADIREAQDNRIRGVPFFLFNESFAVSGAQDPAIFLNALNKANDHGIASQDTPDDGSVCAPGQECEE
jgi:predicted DsbA family dithiol-disulfide isomerase